VKIEIRKCELCLGESWYRCDRGGLNRVISVSELKFVIKARTVGQGIVADCNLWSGSGVQVWNSVNNMMNILALCYVRHNL